MTKATLVRGSLAVVAVLSMAMSPVAPPQITGIPA